jgi:hypothetical protein
MKHLLFILSLMSVACNSMEDSPEKIDKLRALGVDTDQVGYSPSTADNQVTANLTFYLASVAETELNWQYLTLENENQITLSEPQITSEDHPRLQLYRVTTTASIPTLEELDFSEVDNTARIYYALGFTQGAEEERVRGQLKIYRADDPRLTSLTEPSISITSPTPNSESPVGTIPLQAELTNQTPELDYRVNWFVTEGKIAEPNSTESEWEQMSAGDHTIIVTVRGLDTVTYDLDLITITLTPPS